MQALEKLGLNTLIEYYETNWVTTMQLAEAGLDVTVVEKKPAPVVEVKATPTDKKK